MSNKEPPNADILQGTLDLMVRHTLEVLGPLTAAGRRQLASEKAEWERTASIITALLREAR
jgi:hypothetical protein